MRAGLRFSVLGALCLAVLLGAAAPESPVADAAQRGDLETVRQLLRDGADVNAAQPDGMSALHWAADRGDAELTQVLLYAGATVSAETRIGAYTPLHIASRNSQLAVVDALLDAGADVNAVTDPSGSMAIHLAASGGDPDVIARLIEAGADANAVAGEWKQTPLIFAAAANRVAAIEALIAHGADPNMPSQTLDLIEHGRVSQAANRRQQEVLRAFTNDGELSATSEQVQAAVRASRQIYENGVPEPRRRGRGGGDDDDGGGRGGFDRGPPSIISMGGLTPLMHAARQGHVEALAALIEGGADVDQVGNGDGTSPLLIATINGQFDAAMVLLDHGADPNIASELNGVTPMWAVVNSEWQPRTRFPQPQEREKQEHSYLQVVEALLEAGAEPNARTTMHPWYMVYGGCGNRNCGLIDTNGSTAFLRAAYATDVDAMRLLWQWGADPFIATKAPPVRQRRDPDEEFRQDAIEKLSDADTLAAMADTTRTTLMLAVWGALPDSVKTEIPEFTVLDTPEAVLEDLLAHAHRADSVKALRPDPSGLPPVPVGGPGVYAIHAASGVGYGEGFAGNAHRHVEDGWLPAVKFLVEEVGMDVNARDHNGYTPLHHAAARGDNEMILYLVEKGADVTAISRRGQTTADMANGPVSRVSPIPETVALLESLGSANSHNCLTCQ